jgi:hypothetical protein
MYASNSCRIRPATAEDQPALRHLAQLDAKPPLDGPVLIGEIAGTPVAALALDDGRAIADPFIPTDHLLATLRVRAKGVRATERRPALRERLRNALPRVARGRA